MTTTATPTTSGQAIGSRAVHIYLRRTALRALTAFWLIAALFLLIGTVVYANLDAETAKHSLWEFALVAARWVTLATFCVLILADLPMAVRHGATRRLVFRSAVLISAGAAGAGALLATAGFAIESAAYGSAYAVSDTHLTQLPLLQQISGSPQSQALGWPAGLTMVIEHVVLFLAYAGAGLLIGIAIYRLRIWAAIAVTLAVLVLVVVGVEWLMFTAWFDDDSFARSNGLPPWFSVILAGGVVAVLAVAAWLAIRAVPIRPRQL